MFGVAAEFQDVPLRNAHVFEQHPGGVRKTPDLLTAELRGKAFDHVIEFSMRAAILEQGQEMLAERWIRSGRHRASLVAKWLTGDSAARDMGDLRCLSPIDTGNAANDSPHGQRILLVSKKNLSRSGSAVKPAAQDGEMLHGFKGTDKGMVRNRIKRQLNPGFHRLRFGVLGGL